MFHARVKLSSYDRDLALFIVHHKDEDSSLSIEEKDADSSPSTEDKFE